MKIYTICPAVVHYVYCSEVRCVVMITGFKGFRCFIGTNILPVLLLNPSDSD